MTEKNKTVLRQCLTNNFSQSVNEKKIFAKINLKKHEYKESNLSNARLDLPFSALIFSVVIILDDDVVSTNGFSSEHGTPFTPLLHWWRAQHSSDSLIEYRFQAPLGECRTLQVFYGTWKKQQKFNAATVNAQTYQFRIRQHVMFTIMWPEKFYQKSQMQEEILIINNFIFVLASLLLQLLEAWVKTVQLSTDRHVVLNQVKPNF